LHSYSSFYRFCISVSEEDFVVSVIRWLGGCLIPVWLLMMYWYLIHHLIHLRLKQCVGNLWNPNSYRLITKTSELYIYGIVYICGNPNRGLSFFHLNHSFIM
jgi:hypothetical protein